MVDNDMYKRRGKENPGRFMNIIVDCLIYSLVMNYLIYYLYFIHLEKSRTLIWTPECPYLGILGLPQSKQDRTGEKKKHIQGERKQKSPLVNQ
jgi:hypothetical protein